MIFEQPFFATFVTTFSLIFTLFFYFLSITLIFVSISHFFCKILIVAKVVTDMNVQITQLHWLWCIHGYVDSFLTHSLYHIHTICNCYSYIGSLQFKCDYLKDLKDKPLIWVFKLQVCDGQHLGDIELVILTNHNMLPVSDTLFTFLGICSLDSSGLIAFALSSEVRVQFQVFGRVTVFSLVVRELRGVWVICFCDMVGRSLLLRDRESISRKLLFGLVMVYSPMDQG